MKTRILLFATCLFSALFTMAQSVSDYDGNVYDTVQIGGRVWLNPNLRVTHYNDGTEIPNITDSVAWGLLTTGARCYYGNDLMMDTVYGALYNFFAATNPAKICPLGYHVPTDGEWAELEIAMGGAMVAGGPLKEAGFAHWLSPNIGATNASGFTALPGGARMPTTAYAYLHENGVFWSSTAAGGNAYGRYVWYQFAGIERDPWPKRTGGSIRCIRDFGVGMGSIEQPSKHEVFPNPTRGYIEVTNPDQKAICIELLGTSGANVYRAITSAEKHNIDITQLASGIYFMKIIDGESVSIRKIVKE